jgi:hypothetical protein
MYYVRNHQMCEKREAASTLPAAHNVLLDYDCRDEPLAAVLLRFSDIPSSDAL